MSPHIVVVGDALLDEDLVTTASRLSPDGPAPVLAEQERRDRAGGAALAARLAAGRGGRGRGTARVSLVTPLADDPPGRRLAELTPADVALVPLPCRGGTAVKTRVRCAGQTVARLDRGGDRYAAVSCTAAARAALETADAVLVADYGRGTAAEPALRELLAAAARRVPLVWDPHPRGAEPVPGATLVTPNRDEAAAAAGAAPAADLAAAYRQAGRLAGAWRARAVALTLGGDGVVLVGDGLSLTVPVLPAHGGDPCGAGDCFAATVTAELAAGALPSEAVTTAAGAASRFVAAGGVAALDRGGAPGDGPGTALSADLHRHLDAVRAAGGTVVATGGCFDLLHAGHVATLDAARRLGDVLVVCLNSDASVRRLKGPRRPLQPEQDRRRVLEALRCVDAVVIFDEATPDRVLERLRPDVWVKGGDYAAAELPEQATLARWGGRAVVVPYLAGRSTSDLVELARR